MTTRLEAAARRLVRANGKLDNATAFFWQFDSIDVSQLPYGTGLCYAGYVGGNWPTYSALLRLFAGHHILSIAVNAGQNAECLDIETGDATIAQAYAWYNRQKSRGVARPCLYIQASNMSALEATMAANGIARGSYRLWSAHYTNSAHLCAPNACGYGRSQADATQFSMTAMGRNLDESMLRPDFFGTPAVPTPPKPGNGYAVTTAAPGWWKGQGTLAGRGIDGNTWYTATVDGIHWTTPSRIQPSLKGSAVYHVKTGAPGWWKGTIVFAANGTDNKRYHTSTANGSTWGIPRA